MLTESTLLQFPSDSIQDDNSLRLVHHYIYQLWAWNLFLSGVYTPFPGEYAAHHAFTHIFGRHPIWWLTIALIVGALAISELAFSMIFPSLTTFRG